MAEKLSETQIEERLSELDGWSVQNSKLHREYSFEDFAQALAFVNRVGAIAEEMNHHPEVWFTYGTVVVDIVSHDAGGITAKDFELAIRI